MTRHEARNAWFRALQNVNDARTDYGRAELDANKEPWAELRTLANVLREAADAADEYADICTEKTR